MALTATQIATQLFGIGWQRQHQAAQRDKTQIDQPLWSPPKPCWDPATLSTEGQVRLLSGPPVGIFLRFRLPLGLGCHSFVLNLFRYCFVGFLRNGPSVALYLAQGLVTKYCRYLVRGASTLR